MQVQSLQTGQTFIVAVAVCASSTTLSGGSGGGAGGGGAGGGEGGSFLSAHQPRNT